MNTDFRKHKQFELVSCYRREDEIPVRGGLALSPAEMERLTEHGIPITTNNVQDQYIDGEKNPSFDIPVDRQRGFDINDVWESAQSIRNKIKTAHIKDIAKYGD